jgi:outer membrane protein OmpA-like peptidoglycan-associated protein
MKYIIVFVWLILGLFYYWMWQGSDANCCTGADLSSVEMLEQNAADKNQAEADKLKEEVDAQKAISEAAETKTVTSIKSTTNEGINKLTFYFPSNSSSAIFSKETEENLEEIIDQMKSTNKKVIITGHTDTTGDTENNKTLGRLRADDVKNKLVSKGLDPTRVVALSMGEQKPIAPNNTAEGRQRNRRVELVIE